MSVKRRLKVFDSGVLRKVIGPKTDERTRCGEDCLTKNFMICTQEIIFG